MIRFCKLCFYFSIPFLILLVSYIYFDPFKVIKKYDNYYIEGDGGAVNRNYVSTMNYLNKKDTYHYDSFIFGNSRSLFFFISDWKKYISPKSICYHFSESGGSINGLYYKIKLIDESNEIIKNALLVVDYDLLSRLERDGALFIMPPILNNNQNLSKFHLEHFIQWVNVSFLFSWFDYHITGKYKKYMEDYISKGTNYKYYNPITNEEPRTTEDNQILAGTYFDVEHIEQFRGQQNPSVSPPVIDEKEGIKSLIKIRKVFNKHHTNYRIIVSPLYNQIKRNPKDYKTLCRIFGSQYVYDFSGVNNWTMDYHNYYEPSHYLPSTANEIMKKTYSK